MALLVIRDDHGKSHLIHSSQIGTPSFSPRAIGQWHDVWARLDGPAENNASSPNVESASNIPPDDHYTSTPTPTPQSERASSRADQR